ncbi:hypothetical protein B0H16DRAFT_1616302 [Mycena metata]|uniref:Uncharacterized protein n=1 Tax=Mycena metata TaxID=1033252 RepID=A0AAD7H906_9AGAR|nr:hypothetical protein B0H16DRAFT_1616302 [Mycena metata]
MNTQNDETKKKRRNDERASRRIAMHPKRDAGEDAAPTHACRCPSGPRQPARRCRRRWRRCRRRWRHRHRRRRRPRTRAYTPSPTTPSPHPASVPPAPKTTPSIRELPHAIKESPRLSSESKDRIQRTNPNPKQLYHHARYAYFLASVPPSVPPRSTTALRPRAARRVWVFNYGRDPSSAASRPSAPKCTCTKIRIGLLAVLTWPWTIYLSISLLFLPYISFLLLHITSYELRATTYYYILHDMISLPTHLYIAVCPLLIERRWLSVLHLLTSTYLLILISCTYIFSFLMVVVHTMPMPKGLTVHCLLVLVLASRPCVRSYSSIHISFRLLLTRMSLYSSFFLLARLLLLCTV